MAPCTLLWCSVQPSSPRGQWSVVHTGHRGCTGHTAHCPVTTIHILPLLRLDPHLKGQWYTLDIEDAQGTLLTALSPPYTYYHCCVWILTSKASGPSICQSMRILEDSMFLFTSAMVIFTMPPLLALYISQFHPSLQKSSP